MYYFIYFPVVLALVALGYVLRRVCNSYQKSCSLRRSVSVHEEALMERMERELRQAQTHLALQHALAASKAVSQIFQRGLVEIGEAKNIRRTIDEFEASNIEEHEENIVPFPQIKEKRRAKYA